MLQMTLEDDPFYVGLRLVTVATLQTQEPEMQVRSWDDRSEVVEVARKIPTTLVGGDV